MTKTNRNNTKQKLKRKIFIVLVIFVALIWYVLETSNILTAKKLYNFFGLYEFCDSADDYPVAVHFIDVGCGDSILICCDGHYALIDAGEYSLSSKTVSYLQKCGVIKLDLVIGTHPDSDHIGDMPSVIKNFQIENFWLGYTSNIDAEPYCTVLNELLHTNASICTPSCNEKFSLGGMTLQVLSSDYKYKKDNNNSIVIRATYKDISFLLMGDAQTKVENDLLASHAEYLPATVLKLGHHGSKTSTSQEFLNAVNPQYTVISVGEQNKNLPSREVVDRISETKILRTDFHGTVITATDGKNIFVFKEKEL